jgi:hypothetical protein
MTLQNLRDERMETHEILKAAGCQMQVVCGKQWDELITTEEEGIRFCSDCKQAIFRTATPAELRVAAEKGVCVYIVPDSAAANERNQIKFKITRERIRKIEAKALKRLKGPTMGVPFIR